MPSDDRTSGALQAVAEPREAFRSAVVEAVEEVRGFLARHGGGAGSDADSDGAAERELGAFASGRIAPDRFAALFGASEGLDPDTRARVERALGILSAIAEGGDEIFRVEIPAGGEPAEEVGRALARIGRVFGAAQLAERVRSGRASEAGDELLEPFPFRRWNRAERQIAPPLVVEVDGGDLQVGGLAELLDGRQRLVLVIRGEMPPAPLARLVTPGVLVMQTQEVADLGLVAGASAPAIAALVPAEAARFVHDPAGGPRLVERLQVNHLPSAEENGHAVGSVSAFQGMEDLRHLTMLRDLAALERMGEPPVAAVGGGAGEIVSAVEVEAVAVESSAPVADAPPHTVQPVELLASWLLRQADL